MLEDIVDIFIRYPPAVGLPLGVQVEDKARHAVSCPGYRNAGTTSRPHSSIAFGASGPMKFVQKMS